MLTPEQVKKVKEQLLAHIEKGFPADKQSYAMKQIEAMGAGELEEFLKKNNLAYSKDASGTECIFCSIVSGKIPSYKIAENKNAIAVLEINPLSRGHVIVIPRTHADSSSGEKLPADAMNLAEEISRRIKSELKPEEVVIKSSNAFGHEILNVIPLYKENLNPEKAGERYSASEEELLSLQKLLSEKEKQKKPRAAKPRTKKIPKKKSEKMILPRRIP